MISSSCILSPSEGRGGENHRVDPLSLEHQRGLVRLVGIVRRAVVEPLSVNVLRDDVGIGLRVGGHIHDLHNLYLFQFVCSFVVIVLYTCSAVVSTPFLKFFSGK